MPQCAHLPHFFCFVAGLQEQQVSSNAPSQMNVVVQQEPGCIVLYYEYNNRLLGLFTVQCVFYDAGVPGEPIPVSSEKDVFDVIGMKYVTPEERSLQQPVDVHNATTNYGQMQHIEFEMQSICEQTDLL